MRRGNPPSRAQSPVIEPSKPSVPTLRYRKPVDRRSRVQRWCDAVAELQDLQDDYQAWLDALPQNMEDSATAEALRAICDLDLSELQSIVPPRGFGRD